MLEKFIYAKKKSLFKEALNRGEILDDAIVFIKDTKEIWTHGQYFGTDVVDENRLAEALEEFKESLNIAGVTDLELDADRGWLKANGTTSSGEDKNFFVQLTEIVIPNTPTIDTTTFELTSGNATVTVNVQASNGVYPELKYKITNKNNIYGSWISLGSGKSKTFNINSEFDDSGTCSQFTRKVKVMSTLNYVDSSEKEYTITIKPKVKSPTISVVRSEDDDNEYGTKLEVKVSPSATIGATNEYSWNNGTWTSFSNSDTVVFTAETTESKKETHTLNVKVRTTKIGYISSGEIANTKKYTIGKEKAYYGVSSLANLDSIGNTAEGSRAFVLSLQNGGKISGAKLSEGAYKINNPTDGWYMWYCCTTKFSNIDTVLVMSSTNQSPLESTYMGQRGDWYCYRVNSGLQPGELNFYHTNNT